MPYLPDLRAELWLRVDWCINLKKEADKNKTKSGRLHTHEPLAQNSVSRRMTNTKEDDNDLP